MRNEVLFSSVDASTNQTSSNINFDKRAQWILTIEKTGTDGDPKIIIERNFSSGKCVAPTGSWFALKNSCENSFDFIIDDTPYVIRDNIFYGNWYRIRLEPNGNTTGTVTATLSYKDYP